MLTMDELTARARELLADELNTLRSANQILMQALEEADPNAAKAARAEIAELSVPPKPKAYRLDAPTLIIKAV